MNHKRDMVLFELPYAVERNVQMSGLFKAVDTFKEAMPGWRIWTACIAFFLMMCAFAAQLSYNGFLKRGDFRPWLDIWIDMMPWWMPWGLLGPLVFALTRVIPLSNVPWYQPLFFHSLSLLVIQGLYLVMAVIGNSFIQYDALTWDLFVRGIEQILAVSLWHMDFLVYLAMTCIGYSFKYYQENQAERERNRILAHQITEVQLQSLKSQLNPHFLFNTLNTIASLIRLDRKDTAVKALSELSLMLRKVLENQSNQMITLEEEVEFIESYLAIQKLRFEQKLETQLQVNGVCLKQEIPFMLLQPLVENAVQHGSQLETNKNTLTLAITCDEERLFVRLTNKVPQHDSHKGFGIGMRNCRERLQHLYHDDFTLTLSPLEDDYFETYLSIPTGEYDVEGDDHG